MLVSFDQHCTPQLLCLSVITTRGACHSQSNFEPSPSYLPVALSKLSIPLTSSCKTFGPFQTDRTSASSATTSIEGQATSASTPRVKYSLPKHLPPSVSPACVTYLAQYILLSSPATFYLSFAVVTSPANMVYSLSYRRPAHVDSSRASIETEKSGKQESISSGASCPYGIPDALSFDKIISGGTCPVCILP